MREDLAFPANTSTSIKFEMKEGFETVFAYGRQIAGPKLELGNTCGGVLSIGIYVLLLIRKIVFIFTTQGELQDTKLKRRF